MFRHASAKLVFVIISGFSMAAMAETEDRTDRLSEFDAVEVSGAFDVHISGKGSPSLQLTADKEILELIETKVVRGTLRVQMTKKANLNGSIKLELTAPNLKRVDLAGAVDASIENVATESFELEASGAIDVRLQGSANSFEIEASGASDIDARELVAKDVDIEVSGAGSAKVYAENSLKAEASGVTSIRYWGNPQEVDRDSSGLSKIKSGD